LLRAAAGACLLILRLCCCRLRQLVANGNAEQLELELQQYEGKSDVKSHLNKVRG
jgi:hypothetical protein